MPDFGQCSEPLCNENSVRLFDCVHHCMKQVCLQHLIEHDRLIKYNDDDLNNLRTELKQLWTTYSLLIDETKLRIEFEQKLKKHQQLIKDASNLFENNSNNIEHYHFMMEKLKQHIEQEKQINQYSVESFPCIEQVKDEPMEKISILDESDSMDLSLATRIERLTSNNGQQQQRKSISDNSSILYEYDHETKNTDESSDNETINTQTTACQSIRRLSGICPFWYDGAYGLTENNHGMYLCSHKKYRKLYRHFVQFHKLTHSSILKIFDAINNKEDPLKTILFQSNDIVIDQINQYQCPFSIYNDTIPGIDNTSERSCRSIKPKLLYTLRYHLTRDHRMTITKADKVVYKLKTTNSQNVIKN